jgi:small subunit ribosomal protein S24e
MELTIKEEKNNPYLKRKEIMGEIIFTGKTPSKEETIKKIAETTKTKEEQIAIKHIYTAFGKEKAKFTAYVYETEEIKKKIEPKQKEKKKTGGQ